MVLEDRNEPKQGLSGRETRPKASCCLVPLGRSRGRPEKREPSSWTDLGSLGLCCREARSGMKPSGLIFASQCAGLKAIPIIPLDLSSFSRAKQDPAHHHLLHLVLPYLPAKPLLRLHCISLLWNGCIFNQFFIHSHSLHPRPISGFFFHCHHSGDTSCKSETPSYAPIRLYRPHPPRPHPLLPPRARRRRRLHPRPPLLPWPRLRRVLRLQPHHHHRLGRPLAANQ